MIRSFRSGETEALFADTDVPRFRAFERIARRKLLYLHSARSLRDLMQREKVPDTFFPLLQPAF